MVSVRAVGRGPIDFVGSDGNQLTIPLSAINFVDGKPTSDIEADGLDVWLKYLADHGQLTPGPAPVPPVAMVFTAVAEAATGNDITVAVAPKGTDAVELTVTERHVYKGLTLKAGVAQSIDKVLDTSSGAILHLKTIGNRNGVPVKGPLNEADDWAIKDVDGNELATLAPRSADYNKGKSALTVGLDEIDDQVTFTLTMEWTSDHFSVAKAGLPHNPLDPLAADDLAFSVTIDKATELPKPGVFALQGGADAKEAKQATATLPANE